MDEVKQPRIILLTGNCGTGKTWTMLSIINAFKCRKRQRYGSMYFHSSDEVVVVGKYDGSMYQGTDRLTFAVMKDYDGFLARMSGKFVILEGDRFMNSKVVNHTIKPFIIKILGDGAEGRRKRGSNQTETHLKKMRTRNNNITADIEVSGSAEAFNYISAIVSGI